MGSYQTAVSTGQAIGIPGAYASANPVISLPIGCTAEEDVQIGGFVWAGSEPGLVKSSADTAVKPLGFVVRAWENALYDAREDASDKIAAKNTVGVQVKGDFYAVSSSAAEAGQKVFATLADGTIQTGTVGASIEGAVETDWIVISGGEAKSLIVISNY